MLNDKKMSYVEQIEVGELSNKENFKFLDFQALKMHNLLPKSPKQLTKVSCTCEEKKKNILITS